MPISSTSDQIHIHCLAYLVRLTKNRLAAAALSQRVVVMLVCVLLFAPFGVIWWLQILNVVMGVTTFFLSLLSASAPLIITSTLSCDPLLLFVRLVPGDKALVLVFQRVKEQQQLTKPQPIVVVLVI